MSLKVGIVGLPNVGKSTLFNALLKKQQAYAANFPFATIEPNVGIVPVPDERLEKLADAVGSEIATTHSGLAMTNNRPPIVPATVEFVDIAGLVAGAHKGEGLGNKFLSHIREVDAIVHVVRDFEDGNIIRAGSIDPESDLEIVKTELELADYEMVERSKNKRRETNPDLPLLSKIPHLVVYNVSEDKYGQKMSDRTLNASGAIVISAKLEEQLAQLDEDERRQYLKELGIQETGLERLIKNAFATLGLITFLTAGVKEVRAWTIKKGTNAQNAAGGIHTDFIKKFIKAEVINFEDFVTYGGWKKSREMGKARLEGRDYIMRDGDVVEFKIGA